MDRHSAQTSPPAPVVIGAIVPEIVTQHPCGLPVLVGVDFEAGRRIAAVIAREDHQGRFGGCQAGDRLDLCPCCGRRLSGIPWDEFQSSVWGS